MGKGKRTKSLDEELGLGVYAPAFQPNKIYGRQVDVSLDEILGLGSPQLANQTTAPAEVIDPSAKFKDPNAQPAPVEEEAINELNNPINFLNRIKQGLVDPIAKGVTESEAFKPIKKSLDLINKGVIGGNDLPSTQFEINNLPRNEDEEARLKEMNQFGFLKGLPKNEKEEFIYKSPVPFNANLQVKQDSFLKQANAYGFNVNLGDPTQVGQTKLAIDRIFADREADINMNNRVMVPTGTTVTTALTEEGRKQIAELHKERDAFIEDALYTFKAAGSETYGADDLDKGQNIHAQEKDKYFNQKEYSKTMAGNKDPFVDKANEEYTIGSQLEKYIRDAEQLSISPDIATNKDKQEQLKSLNLQANQQLTALQDLSNKYPEVRKTELAKVLGEIYQRDNGGFDKGLGIDNYITLDDEKELVRRFMQSSASDADKRLVQEMFEEDEARMKLKLDKMNRGKIEGRGDDIITTSTFEEVERFKNLKFGYGNRFANAALEVFAGSGRGIRDILGFSGTKAGLEESVKDKLELKGYELEGQRFFAPPTILDLDENSATFGQQIENPDAGSINWQNFGYNMAEMGGQLVGQIGEAMLFQGLLGAAGKGTELFKGALESAQTARKTTSLMSNIATRTEEIAKLAKASGEALELGLQRGIKAGKFGATGMIEEGGVQGLKDIASTVVPAFLMSYDNNLKHSYDLFGVDQPWKNRMYASLTSALEGATEMIGNPLNQLKALKNFTFGAAQENIYKFVNQIGKEGFEKMTRGSIKDKLTEVLRNTVKQGGAALIEQSAEGTEEVLSNAGEMLTAYLLDPTSIQDRDLLKESYETYVQTFMGMGFMGLGAGMRIGRDAIHTFNNKHYKDAMIGVARNADLLIPYLDELKAKGEITQAEYDEKKRFVESSKNRLEQMPKVNAATGYKLSQDDLANYMYASVNEEYLTHEMGITTDKNRLDELAKRKKKFYQLREESVNSGDVAYDTNGIPTLIMPEMPESYEKKPEIIGLRAGLKKQKEVIARLHQSGEDGIALARARGLQQNINQQVLKIKQKDPQTEEFVKFEQDKKDKAFELSVKAETDMTKLNTMLTNATTDTQKTLINSRISEIKTKENTAPATASSNYKNDILDDGVKTSTTGLVVGDIFRSAAGKFGVVTKVGATPFQNTYSWWDSIEKAQAFKDKQATQQVTQQPAQQPPIPASGSPLQSNIQGQPPAPIPTGDSQGLQVNKTLTPSPPAGTQPPIVEKMEAKLGAMPPITETDIDLINSLNYNPEDTTQTGQSFLSPESTEDRNAKFERILKRVTDKLGRIAQVQDIIDYVESVYGKERAEQVKGTIEADYNSYTESLRTELDELYGDEALAKLEETIPEPETREGWKERDQRAANAKLVDDTSEAVKPIVEQVSIITWLGNKVITPILKFAFKNISYSERVTEEGNRVFVSRDINVLHAKDILNWKKYPPDHKFTVRYNTDLNVYDWDKNIDEGVDVGLPSKEEVPFGTLGHEYGTPGWINKVPIEVYDEAGNLVEGLFVHDVDWYNRSNVGDVENQEEIIEQGKANVAELRSKIFDAHINGTPFQLEVADRTLGTKEKIDLPTNQLPSIFSNNPQAKIGWVTGNADKSVVAEGELIPANLIEGIETFTAGQPVELRKVNDTKWIALHPVYGDTSNATYIRTSMKMGFGIYMLLNEQHGVNEINIDGTILTKERAALLNKDFKKKGMDLSMPNGMATYLRTFVRVYSDIPDTKKLPEGHVFVVMKSGALSVHKNGKGGEYTKGKSLSGKSVKELTPKSLLERFDTIFNDIQFAPMNILNMQEFKSMDNDLIFLRPHGEGEERRVIISSYKSPNNVDKNGKSLSTYDAFLKDHMKTDYKSWNVGTEEEPLYVTLVQPVVQIKEAGTKTVTITELTNEEKAKQEVAKAREIADKREEARIDHMIEEARKEAEAEEKADAIALQELTNQVVDDSIAILSEFGLKFTSENLSPSFTEAQRLEVTKSINTIEGLSENDKHDIENFILATIFKNLNDKFGSFFTEKEFADEVKISFDSYFGDKLFVLEQQQERIQNLLEVTDNVKLNAVNEAYKLQINNFNIIKENWEAIRDNILEVEVGKYVSFKETDTDEEKTESNIKNPDGEYIKDYDKEGYTENYKNSVSLFVKRFVFTIPNYLQGEPAIGFMGVQTYNRFEDNYNVLMQLIPGENQILSNREILHKYLDSPSIPDAHKPLAKEVANMVRSNSQFSHGLQYSTTKSNLTMKMIMEEYDRVKDEYKMRLMDVNANSAHEAIRQQWLSNHRVSKFFNVSDDVIVINDSVRAKIIEKIEKWSKQTEYSEEDVQKMADMLADMGIKINPKAVSLLLTDGFYKPEKVAGKSKKITGQAMFTDSDGTFFIIKKFLEKTITSEQKDGGKNINFNTNSALNIFEQEPTSIKRLVQLNNKFLGFIPTQSFRDGEKSIYAYENMMLDKQTMMQLKSVEDTVRKTKLQTLFDKHSYILQAMDEDEEVRKNSDLQTSGITSVKIRGKEVFGSAEVKDLADIDFERFAFSLFSHMGAKVNKKTKQGLPMRMATMMGLVSSDKKRRNLMHAPVLALDSTYLNIKTGRIEEGERGDMVREFLFSQLAMPELERIVQHHQQAKTKGIHANKVYNQKDYNLGAQMFLMIPELNNVTIGENKQPILDYIATTDNLDLEDIIAKTKPQLTEVIEKYVNQQVDTKVSKWKGYFMKEGKMDEDDEMELINQGVPIEPGSAPSVTKIKHMDSAYMNGWGADAMDRLRGAALDYIINTTAMNANQFMLFSGDVANFAQDKSFSKGFETEVDELGNEQPLVHRPKEGTSYSDLVRNKIGVNLGKRLAMLIAPGAMLSESIGDSYIQILVKDAIRVADNAVELVKRFYGDAEYEKAKKLLSELDNINDFLTNPPPDIIGIEQAELRKEEIIKKLQKDYKDLAPYFNIESTDAQEYTTWKEHLDVLVRQGRVSEEEFNRITDKLTHGKELLEKDLKLIFQPIKPVYTGVIAEKIENTDLYRNRTLYIKSSSFPLLPQLTKGLELNKLRLDMEKIQSNSKLNVRVAHGTANKVGSTAAPIKIWNEDGSYNTNAFKRININEINNNSSKSALKLNRVNFRIQQDVPYKSSKRKEDKISIGSQLMKILFSDDVKDIIGGQVFKDYQDAFITWSNNERDNLYRELKFDPTTHKQSPETITALKKLLKSEALSRNYTKQDIDILSSLLNNNEFKIPLWMAPNSNRYEAFINAIVTSRLINLKLPGSSFILGSEEGFRRDYQEAVAENRIVYLPNWTGKLKSNQVLLPSKFRDNNGKLIDLTSDDYSTLNKVTGQRYLNLEMFDKELLNLTSFRIPTSSHVSGSQMEVAGFIPVESGDLAIFPRGLMKQKGVDFDVDKENTYWLSHFVDIEGKIKVLNREEVNKTLEEFRQLLDDYKPLTQEGNNKTGEEGLNTIIRTFNAVFGDDSVVDARKNVGSLFKLIKNKLETKLAQNEIIKIHSLVFNSKDERIQQKIQKVLSTDFAEEQADLIDDLVVKADTGIFSLLSDEYQKYKMNLGSTGKTGIGVYSNYVTWHGLSQQTSERIGLETVVDKEMVPYKIKIGNMESNGLFGNTETIKPSNIEDSVWNKVKRSISFAFAERQNTATDNEKLQVMGRVGVNGNTINVDCLLTALGFDKDIVTDRNGEQVEINIPYFLLSQPIIKEYVEALKNAGSQVADFDIAKKKTIKDRLVERYGGSTISDDIKDGDEELLTGQTLYDNLTVKDQKIQQIALKLFTNLSDIADKVQVLQSHLNIQRSGLGESFYEAQSKLDNLNHIASGDAYATDKVMITNTSTYIGTVLDKTDYLNLSPEDRAEYIRVDDNTYIKPVSFTGVLMADAIKSYKDIFEKYFPNKSDLLNQTIDNIISNIGKDQATVAQKLELKYEIAAEIKKYLLSSAIDLYPDAQEERKRLMFDVGDKQSLAKYIHGLKDMPNFEAIVNTNALLKCFDFELNKDGQPSMIKYRNSRGEDLQEEYKYQALVKLMHDNKPLPEFNGDKEYTTTKLVADLISYAYAIGGVQSANEFVKYIPVKLMETLKIDAKLRKIHNGLTLNDEEWYNSVFGSMGSRFQQQFFQHNPKRAKRLEVGNITAFKIDGKPSRKFNQAVTEFQIDAEQGVENPPLYVSIYNEKKPGKGNDKYQLYKLHINEKNEEVYKRIPILGTSMMVEYDSNTNYVQPLLDIKKEKKKPTPKTPPIPAQPVPNDIDNQQHKPATPTPPIPEPQPNPYNIQSGNLLEVLNGIEATKLPYLSDLVSLLKPFIDPQTKIKIIANLGADGKHFPDDNTIAINANILNDARLAQVIVKEYAHSITHGELQKYFDDDGVHTALKQEYTSSSTLKNPDGSQLIKVPPMHIVKLHKLYEEIREKLKDTPEFKSMEAKIINLKRNKGKDTLSAKEFGVYGLLNIFEFTSEIFADRNLQKRLAEMPSSEPHKSLMDRFLDVITELFKRLGVADDTKLRDALNATFELIVESKQPTPNNLIEYKNPLQQQADIAAIKIPEPPASINKEISIVPAPTLRGPTPPIKVIETPQPKVDKRIEEIEERRKEALKDENMAQFEAGDLRVEKQPELLNSWFVVGEDFEDVELINKTKEGLIKDINAFYDAQLAALPETEETEEEVDYDSLRVIDNIEDRRLTELQAVRPTDDMTARGLINDKYDKELKDHKEGKVTIGAVHVQGENAGYDTESPAFKDLSSKITGESHLDKMTAKQLATLFNHLIAEELNNDLKTQKGSTKYELFPGKYANEKQEIAIDKVIEFLNADTGNSNEWYKDQFLLKGRGGTGKTTIIKKALEGRSGVIGATVADEAKNILKENLPEHRCVTVASLIGLVADYSKTGVLFFRERNAKEEAEFRGKGKSDPIEGARIILIDEASMISPYLYKVLLAKKLPSAKVIFMGDNAQIPPIDDAGGTVESPVFELEKTSNFSELTVRMRQGEESPILPVTDVFAMNVENIQKGKPYLKNPLVQEHRTNNFDEATNSGVLFLNDDKELINMFIEDFQSSDDLKNVIIVAARNETVNNYNSTIRDRLFDSPNSPFVIGDIIRTNSPHVINKQVVLHNGMKGKVTQVRKAEVLNGFQMYELVFEGMLINEEGEPEKFVRRVPTIDPMEKNRFKAVLSQMAVKAKSHPFGSAQYKAAWREFFAFQEKVVDIGYNYAITAHKVQGSTYKNTYVMEADLMSFPGGDLQTNRMMYTAVSRPKFKLVIYNPVQVVNNQTVKPQLKQQDVEFTTDFNYTSEHPNPFVGKHPPISEQPLPNFDDYNDMNTDDAFKFSSPPPENLSPTPTEITEDSIDSMLEELGITKTCD